MEETAGRLGLMKIDQSQITYIRLGESDTLERTQSAVRQWTDFIYNGAVNILGTAKVNQIRESVRQRTLFGFTPGLQKFQMTKARQKAANARCRRSSSMEILPKVHQKNKRPWPASPAPVPA